MRSHARLISLPFCSEVLVRPDPLLTQKTSLLSIPVGRYFTNLPVCLHDRHCAIRKRLIAAWREPVADLFKQRLQGHLTDALKAIEQRLAAWVIAFDLSVVFDGCLNLRQVIQQTSSELFRADGIETFLHRVVPVIARNTRNFTTARWIDREYERIINVHSHDASSVLAMVIELSRIRTLMTDALEADASRFGLKLKFNCEAEPERSREHPKMS